MLNEEQLERLADLARLELSKEEKDKLNQDLAKILDYVDQIKKAQVSEKILTSIFKSTYLREDKEVRRQVHHFHQIIEKIQKNFPEKTEDAYLKVPKVLEKD